MAIKAVIAFGGPEFYVDMTYSPYLSFKCINVDHEKHYVLASDLVLNAADTALLQSNAIKDWVVAFMGINDCGVVMQGTDSVKLINPIEIL